MRLIEKREIELERVKTKSGVELWKIEVSPDLYYLEQNPQKESIFGEWYRKKKGENPNFYLFWEFKNGEYSGRVLVGEFKSKQELLEQIKGELSQ
jgi:hypothetical protein